MTAPDPWVLVAGGFHRNGGMDKANLSLAEYLVSEGVNVHLVTYSADESIQNNPLVRTHTVARPFNSFTLGRPFLDLKGRQVAKKITSRHPGAVVVVNGANCRWAGINWAHYVHHAWSPLLQETGGLQKAARAAIYRVDKLRERSAYSRAHMVVANSELTRRHLIKDVSISPARVRTLYLGSDEAWSPATATERRDARSLFNLSQSKYYAGFVGALGNDKRKGIDTLLAAWQILTADKQWDVNLLIAGSGRQLSHLRSEIAASELAHRVSILGFCPNVRQLLAACDLLVSPARYEAYGLNVQEAICRGLPSIVSLCTGIAERYPLDLRALLLSDPENVAELVQKLRLWRANIPGWKIAFEPFSAELRSNTWRNMAKNFVSLAQEINIPASQPSQFVKAQ